MDSAIAFTATTATRTLRFPLRRAGWFVAFAATAYVGRATLVEDRSLALVWPAAGMALLWIATGNRHTAGWDVGGIVAAMALVDLTTGAPVEVAAVFLIANLLQLAVVLAYLQHALPDVWGFGGHRPLERLRDLGQLATGAALGSVVGALVGTVGLVTLGHTALGVLPVWWARNTTGMVVIGAVGLILAPKLARAGSPRRVRAALRSAARRGTGSRVEGIALVAASVDLYWLAFSYADMATLFLLLLALATWAGARFSPFLVGLHGLAMATVGVVLTMLGVGPFAGEHAGAPGALLVQVFVTMATTAGLILAFSRQERHLAVAEAAARARRSERIERSDSTLTAMRRELLAGSARSAAARRA